MSESKESDDRNFRNCLIFVKETWPDEPPHIQMIRAEAVYEISKVFFNEIAPKIVKDHLMHSDN